MRWFERLNECGRIQSKNPRQLRTRPSPAFARGKHGLATFSDLGPRPNFIDGRNQALCQFLGAIDQVLGSLGGILSSGKIASRLLHVEIRFCHGQHAIVHGRL